VAFIKLIRALTAVLAIWLIWRLLHSLGKRGAGSRVGIHDAGNTRRKFVESSVVDKESSNRSEDES